MIFFLFVFGRKFILFSATAFNIPILCSGSIFLSVSRDSDGNRSRHIPGMLSESILLKCFWKG